jgi:hypothetical protein
MKDASRVAEVQYSPEYERLEITLPRGAKFTDVPRFGEDLLSERLLERLGVACPNCQTGIPLIIRERFENVLRVDLDSKEVIEQ